MKKQKCTILSENAVSDTKNTLEVHINDYTESILTETGRLYPFFKRCFDIIVAGLGIFVLLILLPVFMIIILIDSPGASPIYSQKRVGKNGKHFTLYKFRSMCPNADQIQDILLPNNEMTGPVFKIRDDPRITRFGRFIRRTGMDELPQLWNVLVGDMSLVGPRPPLPREVALYSELHHKRLLIKPGITCYWQVQPQRNSLSFEEWFALDMKYMKERSFRTDLWILYQTIGAIKGMEGE